MDLSVPYYISRLQKVRVDTVNVLWPVGFGVFAKSSYFFRAPYTKRARYEIGINKCVFIYVLKLHVLLYSLIFSLIIR